MTYERPIVPRRHAQADVNGDDDWSIWRFILAVFAFWGLLMVMLLAYVEAGAPLIDGWRMGEARHAGDAALSRANCRAAFDCRIRERLDQAPVIWQR